MQVDILDRIIGFLLLTILFYVIFVIVRFRYRHRHKRRMRKLLHGKKELTVEEFFDIRQEDYVDAPNFEGVYILFNRSRNLYYVGQSLRVFSRVNSHFTGKGNGDVYADYIYGDDFRIRMISLKGSGYRNLDDLERETIERYDAYAKGYNRTKGNMGS